MTTVSAVAVPWRRRNDDDTVVSAQATPERREGVAWADTRQRADTEEVLGAETSCRSWITYIEPNNLSPTDERDQSRVRGRSPRTQKSQPLYELVSTVADTAFGE